MRANEIKVGGLYVAKVSGQLTTVRVDAIDYVGNGFRVGGAGRTGRKNNLAYRLTNLSTGRKTTLHSAAKFRCEAKSKPQTNVEEIVDRVLAGEKGLKVEAIRPEAIEPQCDACSPEELPVESTDEAIEAAVTEHDAQEDEQSADPTSASAVDTQTDTHSGAPIQREDEQSADPTSASAVDTQTDTHSGAPIQREDEQSADPISIAPTDTAADTVVLGTSPTTPSCGVESQQAQQQDDSENKEDKECSDPIPSLFSMRAAAAMTRCAPPATAMDSTAVAVENRQADTMMSQPALTSMQPSATKSAQLTLNGTTPSSEISNVTTASLASRIAASRSTGRQVGTPVAGMVPNDEQENIISVAKRISHLTTSDGIQVLVVVAGAGSGKTASCKMLEEILEGAGQYTAFSKKLIEESRSKFKKAKVSTTFALAYGAVGRQYAHRLNGARQRSDRVANMLGIQDFMVLGESFPKNSNEWNKAALMAEYTESNPPPSDFAPCNMKRLKAKFLAGQLLEALKRFAQSADRKIGRQHFLYIPDIDQLDGNGKRTYDNNNAVRDYLLPFADKAWRDIKSKNGQLRFEHIYYVKLWQLGEGNDRPIICADYLLLDEYQDTQPVLLDVIMQQRCMTVVMVGDDNQRIFEFTGSVNASEYFPDAPRCLLSQSYRFGQAVADVANTILRTLEEPTELVMRGNPTIPSRVDVVAEPRCWLYRNNAGAIGRVMVVATEGKRPHLVGKVDDIIAWCGAAVDLQGNPPRGTDHPELGCFSSWGEVQEYSKTDEGADLRLMVKIIDEFGAAEIISVLRHMPKEEDADLVVSTAHKSKGCEWDTVKLGPDFPVANKMSDSDRRLLYVAATRAKHTLDVSECPPFCGEKDKQTGEWIPGLRIAYSQPMPTEEEQTAWLATLGQAKSSKESGKPAVKEAEVVVGRFTWTKQDNAWMARGPAGVVVGARITVARRDGSSQVMTVKRVVQQYPDSWVYEV